MIHILIVDDEEMLVDMMQQVLEQLGYTVSAHTDSAEALKAFLACPRAYDLLITDMTMPGMTGTGLAKAVKAVAQRPSHYSVHRIQRTGQSGKRPIIGYPVP